MSVAPRTTKNLLWLALLGLICGRLIYSGGSGDFVEYWAAGRVFLDGGNPYSNDELLSVERAAGWEGEQALMMWNPPWTLVFVLPFSLLPFKLARLLWGCLQFGLSVWAADWLWRYYGGTKETRWVSWLMTTLLFFPAFLALQLGQISPLIFVGLTLFLWALERGSFRLAGIAAFPVTVKPQLLFLFWPILVLWSLRARQWKVVLTLGAALGTSLLMLTAWNPNVLPEYVVATREGGGPLVWLTPTVGALLRKLLSPDRLWLQFLPAVLGLVWAVWLWIGKWKKTFSWRVHSIPVILLSICTTSFGWTFDWVVALPALLQMAVWYLEEPRRRWLLLTCLIGVNAAMPVVAILARDYFPTLWFPWALGLLYLLAARSGNEPSRAEC